MVFLRYAGMINENSMAFQARIAAKEVKDVVRLRNIFVHNDVVIRVYGDEGYPDVYKVSHDISTLLKCMKEKMNKTPELLPCPFCGDKAGYYVSGDKGYVYCTGCGVSTDGSYVYRDPNWAQEEARSWNTRVNGEDHE